MSDRRQFITGAGLAAFSGLGAIGALYAAKKTWEPLPSVKAAGFATLNMKDYKENELKVEQWRGKPIFVLKQSKEMLAKATEEDKKRVIKVGDGHFVVCVGLCTHLGCIPGYNPEDMSFLCACHGGRYDAQMDVTKAPPPRGLDIPPFKIDGDKLVLGEEGPEYKKMLADGVTMPV